MFRTPLRLVGFLSHLSGWCGISGICILCLPGARDAGNEKWNEPEIKHPTGGFLSGFIPTFPAHQQVVPAIRQVELLA